MKRENWERVRQILFMLDEVEEHLVAVDVAEKLLAVPPGKFGMAKRKRLTDKRDRLVDELEAL